MDNKPVKQLNNFAKVIKVDDKEQPIQEEVKEVHKERNNKVVNTNNLIIKESDPMIPFYIVIILILLAILLSFVVFYILPRIK